MRSCWHIPACFTGEQQGKLRADCDFFVACVDFMPGDLQGLHNVSRWSPEKVDITIAYEYVCIVALKTPRLNAGKRSAIIYQQDDFECRVGDKHFVPDTTRGWLTDMDASPR